MNALQLLTDENRSWKITTSALENILTGREASFDEPDIFKICMCCETFRVKENPTTVFQMVRNEMLSDAADDEYYWRCVTVALEVIATAIGRAVYF